MRGEGWLAPRMGNLRSHRSVASDVLFPLQFEVVRVGGGQLAELGNAIAGLQRIDLGPPAPESAHRALGFDMGLVAVLDGRDTIGVYAGHAAHLA